MKKTITLIAIFLIHAPLAFAITNKCDTKYSDAIHCVYYTGDQSNKNGRYVKSTSKGKSFIHCARGGFYDFIPQQANKEWGKGKEVFSYEQCLDAECKNSRKLGTDTFTIIKNDKGYTSFPRSFKIHLSSNYGAPCTTWK